MSTEVARCACSGHLYFSTDAIGTTIEICEGDCGYCGPLRPALLEPDRVRNHVPKRVLAHSAERDRKLPQRCDTCHVPKQLMRFEWRKDGTWDTVCIVCRRRGPSRWASTRARQERRVEG